MADYSHTFYNNSTKIDGYADNFTGYHLKPSSFGFTTDPRTANQLKAVSDKLNTGAKVIEVSGVNIAKGEGPLGLIDYIPKQHLQEINRLRKLAGAELTFHAPLVEATGWNDNGWNEEQRKQVEREVLSSIERGHELDPKGNIVITFHTSNGLPEPATKVKIKGEDGKMKEISSRFVVIDERTGRIGVIPGQQQDYWKNQPTDPKTQIDDYNKRQWSESLSQVTRLADQARISMVRSSAIRDEEGAISRDADFKKNVTEAYKYSTENPKKFEHFLNDLGSDMKKDVVLQAVNEIGFADRYAESAYLTLKEIYNEAYDNAKKQNNEELKEKLQSIRKEIAPSLENLKEKTPDKLKEFIDEIAKATRSLDHLGESKDGVPKQYRFIKDFGVEKASETFANAAFSAYKQFGKTTPILGLENPPAGMGINRAEDIKELVEAAHKKFVVKAVQDGMSEKAAEKKAKELIGVTWDVGHINMIRKYGYDDKDLKKQTETIAPFVKHVHLSDNFGLAHTELPMGMGNVPIKAHEEALRKEFGEKFGKIKQIVETGGWFADFKTTPFRETMAAFGSPLYPQQMGSYWKQPPMGGYFAGYGKTLPDVHFQTYGAGFSGLPTDLGGEIQGRSRVSGNPIE